jgi:hypothetical protein
VEDIGIFYGSLVYFAAVWYILCPFGIFCGGLAYFFLLWYVAPCKICNPTWEANSCFAKKLLSNAGNKTFFPHCFVPKLKILQL